MFQKRRLKRSANPAMSRVVHLGLIACLLAMALLPLVGTGTVSAANDGDPIVLVDAVDPQVSVIDPQEEPVVPVDIVPGGSEGNATVVLPVEPQETGAVAVVKHACPDGFDAMDADLNDLYANCGVLGGVGFLIGDANGGSTAINTDGAGEAYLDGLPAGLTTVTEQVPEGFATPRVFCATAYEGDAGSLAELPVDQSTVWTSLDAGQTFACDWFNVPANDPSGQSEDAQITLHKQLCPTGYDASQVDLDTLRNDCAKPQEGIDFTFSNVNPQAQDSAQQGTTDVDGLVFVTIADPAELTIAESLGGGYATPVVYCGNPLLDPQLGGFSPEQVSGNAVTLDLTEGQVVYCDWFNIPSGENGIVIYKHVCPAGFDAYNVDADGLAANCDDLQDGVTFDVTDGGPTNLTGTTDTDGDGEVVFGGLDAGEYFISEELPQGYGAPVVYCATAGAADGEPADYSGMDLEADGSLFSVLATDDVLWCHWFNVPSDDVTVTIDKYECPQGFDAFGASVADLSVSCSSTPMDGVDFTLSYPIDTILHGTTGDAGPGQVSWSGIGQVTVWITEDIPAGYGEPVVLCFLDDVAWSPDGPRIATEDGTIQIDLSGHHDLHCEWFNVPTDNDVTITIVKYTCAPGYDLTAPGAAPAFDCPDRTNGIGFALDGQGEHEQGVTGDDGEGTVTFSGLAWHPWEVSENVPAGTDYSFVLSCEGSSAQQIQGYPLLIGDVLGIDVAPGDHVTCYWYNVPEIPGGTVTIVKEYCEGTVFVSSDDCQIYEDGAGFSLTAWNGSDWVEVANGTTDGGGFLSWSVLQAGTYQIDEIGGTWCYAAADRTDENGYLIVLAGKQTTVTVYNCGAKVPTKKPRKFPNTGVGPGAPAWPAGHDAPVSPADDPAPGQNAWPYFFDGRRTPPSSVATKPVSLRIASVGIDAETETLEIVAGDLQDPTSADKVAWYKDTAKLGEPGNVVMAGHLNYWGVPEGVFFRLAGVKKGDIVEVTGANGLVYRYKVQWVKQVDVAGADVANLVGETKQPSLTLITCGGEWDGAAQEYNQRTVLRAVLVTE